MRPHRISGDKQFFGHIVFPGTRCATIPTLFPSPPLTSRGIMRFFFFSLDLSWDCQFLFWFLWDYQGEGDGIG